MSLSELEIDLNTATMHCTTDEISTVFSALLREMRRMIPRLRPDELATLRRIMSEGSCTVTVAELFPDFARESEPHLTLRRLRAAQFIRPAKTGRWEPAEPIEVKPFARLMWDRIGEDGLFAKPAPSVPSNEQPTAQRPTPSWDDDLIDLADFGGDQLQPTM
ncbi:MAG: hypothetical protein K8U57_36490 [Planctomycetes bacterium]|nr:hypothetical protein [Planctomycetota bacterium]